MLLQIGVKALIKNSNDEYLFLRRSDLLSTDSNETTWDIPGGRINPEENLIDALQREIKEEIGHSIRATPELIAAQDIFVASKDLHVVRLTYVIEENVPDIQLSDEHIAYQWVDRGSIGSIRTEPYLGQLLNNPNNIVK